MELILIKIIQVMHLVLITFVLGGWVDNNLLTMILYISTIITLQFHWIGNNDTCFLTLVEQKLSGKPKKETFFGRLMKPVYKLDNEFQTQLSYFITSVLLVIVLYKFKYSKDLPIVVKAFGKGFNNGVKKLKEIG